MTYLVVYQELWSLEVSGGYPNVVLLPGVVKLSQPPVYQAELRGQKERVRACTITAHCSTGVPALLLA